LLAKIVFRRAQFVHSADKNKRTLGMFRSSPLCYLLPCLLFALIPSRGNGKPSSWDEAPNYACTANRECSAAHCCVLGFERYSLPRCQALGSYGDWCFERSRSSNRTLIYPTGEVVHFEDTYNLFCPCAEGLTCRDNTCKEAAQAVSRRSPSTQGNYDKKLIDNV